MIPLGRVKLEYPHLLYTVSVQHYTTRRSTALEWAVLEALSIIEMHVGAGYEGMFVNDFLHNILSIDAGDQLIKPLFTGLEGIGALRLDAFSDTTSLSEITMSQIHMTDEGRRLQRNGLLPGVDSEAILHLDYDICRGELSLQGPDTPSSVIKEGLAVQEINFDDIAFPMEQLHELLDRKRREGGKGRLSWLQQGTEIRDIAIGDMELHWQHFSQKMECDENGQFCVQGSDELLAERVLENGENLFGNQGQSVLNGFPVLYLAQPELKFFPFENMEQEIEKIIVDPGCNLCILSSAYLSFELPSLQKRQKRRVVVRCGEESISLVTSYGQIILSLPENLLPKGCAVLSNRQSVGGGRLQLKAGAAVYEVLYGWSKNDESAVKVLKKAVCQHAAKDLRLLALLMIFGVKREEIESIALKILAKLKDVQNEWEAVEGANNFAKEELHEPVLNAGILRRLFVEDVSEGISPQSVAEVDAELDKVASIDLYKNDTDIGYALLTKLLSSIRESQRVQDLWNLWARIRDSVPKIWCRFIKSKDYQQFYGDSQLAEILSGYNQDGVAGIVPYTPVEQAVQSMHEAERRIRSLWPEFSLKWKVREMMASETILAHRTEAVQIGKCIELWQVEAMNLQSYAEHILVKLGDDSYFTRMWYLLEWLMPLVEEQCKAVKADEIEKDRLEHQSKKQRNKQSKGKQNGHGDQQNKIRKQLESQVRSNKPVELFKISKAYPGLNVKVLQDVIAKHMGYKLKSKNDKVPPNECIKIFKDLDKRV